MCPAHDRAQKPVRVTCNREEPPVDFKESQDVVLGYANSTQIFKHAGDVGCDVVSV